MKTATQSKQIATNRKTHKKTRKYRELGPWAAARSKAGPLPTCTSCDTAHNTTHLKQQRTKANKQQHNNSKTTTTDKTATKQQQNTRKNTQTRANHTKRAKNTEILNFHENNKIYHKRESGVHWMPSWAKIDAELPVRMWGLQFWFCTRTINKRQHKHTNKQTTKPSRTTQDNTQQQQATNRQQQNATQNNKSQQASSEQTAANKTQRRETHSTIANFCAAQALVANNIVSLCSAQKHSHNDQRQHPCSGTALLSAIK